MANYEVVIGFEVHTELRTETKVFCGCSTEFGAPPNTHVCPICLGMPGVLPVLNKKAVEFAIRTSIALNCDVPKTCKFDRKNYYYPDLPKNYQISQQYACVGTGGWIDIEVNGTQKRVRMNNVHLEEDAGKLVHSDNPGCDYSLVDLNRAGTPLLEIVSEPDLRSADEALAYMNALKNLLEYIEVSDCKMQEGRLRFELNISLREEGSDKFGTKVEIKNLNSMRTVLKCIDYETRRQTEVLTSGGRVYQETRLWDDVKMCTRAMRSKEVANDYRYFPDPDLVEVEINDELRERITNSLPELQREKCKRFQDELGLPEYDAKVLTASKKVANYYEKTLACYNQPKAISNWMMTEVLRELNAQEIEPEDFVLKPEGLAKIVSLIDEGKISGKIAKVVFSKVVETGKDPLEIIEKEGLIQVNDSSEVEKWVDEAIQENPDIIAKIAAGQTKSKQALVGQVMKKSCGKANPKMVNEDLLKKLGM